MKVRFNLKIIIQNIYKVIISTSFLIKTKIKKKYDIKIIYGKYVHIYTLLICYNAKRDIPFLHSLRFNC